MMKALVVRQPFSETNIFKKENAGRDSDGKLRVSHYRKWLLKPVSLNSKYW